MTCRLASVLALTVLMTACGGGSSSPTAPSTPAPPATTRIVGVSGNLNFGDVPVGATRDAVMTITNSGNAVLTVTSLSTTGGFGSMVTASWTSGTIPAGGSQAVTVRFLPTAAGSYSGSMVVNGDQTSGTNSLALSGTASVSFTGTWAGGHVISQCNGTGSAQDLICGASRGAFKVGSNMSFEFALTQNGTSVTGTGNLGGTVGPVNGTITNGVLTLAGTLRDTQGFTAVITGWTTSLSGSNLTGTVAYTLTYSGLPGNAGIVASLNGVTRR